MYLLQQERQGLWRAVQQVELNKGHKYAHLLVSHHFVPIAISDLECFHSSVSLVAASKLRRENHAPFHVTKFTRLPSECGVILSEYMCRCKKHTAFLVLMRAWQIGYLQCSDNGNSCTASHESTTNFADLQRAVVILYSWILTLRLSPDTSVDTYSVPLLLQKELDAA